MAFASTAALSALSALPAYPGFSGALPLALTAARSEIIAGLLQIVATEGPVRGFRLHRAYVTASGQRRVGKQIAHALNAALTDAVRQGLLFADNPLHDYGLKPRTYRAPGRPGVAVRQLGPRTLEQVPALELATLLSDSATAAVWDSTESLFRDVLHRLGRDRRWSRLGAAHAGAAARSRSLRGGGGKLRAGPMRPCAVCWVAQAGASKVATQGPSVRVTGHTPVFPGGG